MSLLRTLEDLKSELSTASSSQVGLGLLGRWGRSRVKGGPLSQEDVVAARRLCGFILYILLAWGRICKIEHSGPGLFYSLSCPPVLSI